MGEALTVAFLAVACVLIVVELAAIGSRERHTRTMLDHMRAMHEHKQQMSNGINQQIRDSLALIASINHHRKPPEGNP